LHPPEISKANKNVSKLTYSRVRVGKHLSDRFPIKNALKQGDALSPLLFNFASDSKAKLKSNSEV
jgi:hypothetical protein